MIEEFWPPDLLLRVAVRAQQDDEDGSREPAPADDLAFSGHRVRAAVLRSALWQRGRPSTAGFRCAAQSFSPWSPRKAIVNPRRLAVRDARRQYHGLHWPCPGFSPDYPPAARANAKREARRQLLAGHRRRTGPRTTNRVFPCRQQGAKTVNPV